MPPAYDVIGKKKKENERKNTVDGWVLGFELEPERCQNVTGFTCGKLAYGYV